MSNPSIPTELTFENAFEGSFVIKKGVFNLTEIDQKIDNDGFPSPQNIDPNKLPNVERLIQVDQGANINLTFSLEGSLAGFLAGKWRAEAFFEKMGAGEFPGDAPSNVAPYDSSKAHYSINIPIRGIDAGMYRIVVCLTFEGPNGQQGPVAAFGDLGVVKFYKESR